MQGLINTGYVFQEGFLLVMIISARIVPVVQLVPYLGGKATPQVVKMGISLCLALLLMPLVWQTKDALPNSPPALAVIIAKEVLVGMTIGFVGALVFEALRIAGQIMDTTRGQNMATAMVPQLPERVSLSADVLLQLGIAIFLIIGGHRVLISALLISYKAVPVHVLPDAATTTQAAALIAELFGASFTVALLMAFPVVASVLLAELVLALINKSAPNVNVFFLGMPLKAMIGLFALMVSLESIINLMISESLFELRALSALLESLAP
ncbi:flagellar biosynthetic protein FliR [Microvenator marinus]|uniref:Flagellar biosynthetic protein FliR n=1 Tax=Microvenator marinus TaxID=2600177 RepID=A0A5B8XQQ3_9DELT|nr:flagellar biosynthetic protein FliR [Microvenator marinus]QED27447.1 flagellar biosynthetic protein FliR [Microvenator marinus]